MIFFTQDVPEPTRERLAATAAGLPAVRLAFIHRTDETDLLQLLGLRGKLFVLNYNSPKDLEYTFGWNKLRDAIDRKNIRQRNNLSGKIGHAHVKDLYGLAGRVGLAKFAAALGVEMANKGGMDEYKSHMWDGLLAEPEMFLRYAADDAALLPVLFRTFVEYFRTIQTETLGMADEDLWTEETIPMTTGSLVARTFEKWIYSRAGAYKDALRFSLRKLGMLRPDVRNSRRDREDLVNFILSIHTFLRPEDLQENRARLANFFDLKFQYTGLDAASVRWWASRPTTETAPLNAMVSGGRCCNENPFEYHLGPGLDVDMAGCYGSALRSLRYPIGVPTSWTYSVNEADRPTLGQWLAQNEGQLMDGLWTCTVGGPLSFEQDLIYSKLVDPEDIPKAVRSQEAKVEKGIRMGDYNRDEDTDIPSDFVLLRREIHNGIITSDLLRTLRQVATTREWAELLGLRIVTAAAYLKNNEQPDVEAWCREIMAHGGQYASVPLAGGGTEVRDDRSHAWFALPLEEFIGKLVDARRPLKKAKDDASLPAAERARAAGLDHLYKLTANVLYGVLCSRHFSIGNTILANTITARARAGVWMVAKALNTRQSITDGGIYEPGRVCTVRGARRPGLATLSRSWDWYDPDHGRYHTRMGGLDWPALIRQGRLPSTDEINKMAMAHVADFWKPYGLELQFRLEHKSDNTFLTAAYWSKADYALRLCSGETKYKLRGKDKDRKDHPTFALLDAILADRDDFPKELTYRRGGLLKIPMWLRVTRNSDDEQVRKLRPGDDVPRKLYPVRYNNTYWPLATVEDYLRRKNRKAHHRGRDVPWFERYGGRGIAFVHSRMQIDRI